MDVPVMRVAIGGISHETNTFSSIQTTLAHFQERALLRGESLIASSRGIGNTLGGMVDAAEALGWQLVPTIFASATPSGRVRRGTFEALVTELVDGIRLAARANGGLDGVLLALHGAMVTEALGDAEGEILRRVRGVVGGVPIVVVLDFHTNLTELMTRHADIILAYETYPHIDTYARGTQAVTLLERLHRREIQPRHILRQIPILAPLSAQATDTPTPMREIARLATRLRQTPGVVSIVVAGGFPYGDVPDAGISVLVTTDDDDIAAATIANRIARACWERRRLFVPDVTTIDDALLLVRRARAAPIVLADVADNPGAGGSGDGTAILEALISAQIPSAAVAAIADPETVVRARAVGVGSTDMFDLGAKIDHLHGTTLRVEARVAWIGECSFENEGPMGAGGVSRLGLATVLEIATGASEPVEVIVMMRRCQVLDPAMFRTCGIEPEKRKVLVLKSSVHYRAAFAPIAADMIDVGGPGLSSPDLLSFPYRKVRRPIWPLDPDMEW